MRDCGHCTRRDFVATGTLAAVGAFLAACGGDDGNTPTGLADAGITVTLANFPALAAVGGIARVTTTGTPVAVVRTGADSYRAFSMVCPHQGTTINIGASGFQCPNHGARFNATGTWIGGQSTSNLREFRVTSNASAGTITITN